MYGLFVSLLYCRVMYGYYCIAGQCMLFMTLSVHPPSGRNLTSPSGPFIGTPQRTRFGKPTDPDHCCTKTQRESYLA
jgi:hypothetical protein